MSPGETSEVHSGSYVFLQFGSCYPELFAGNILHLCNLSERPKELLWAAITSEFSSGWISSKRATKWKHLGRGEVPKVQLCPASVQLDGTHPGQHPGENADTIHGDYRTLPHICERLLTAVDERTVLYKEKRGWGNCEFVATSK